MKLVFADSFYWIALADYTDNSHQHALKLTAELASAKIMSSRVVGRWCKVFGVFWEAPQSPSSRKAAGLFAARDRYEARSDKGYSLTDCISMQTMEREGVKDVLTNDRHFEQEDFRATGSGASLNLAVFENKIDLL